METLEIIYIIISFVFGVFVSPYLKRTIENIADTHWSYRKEKAKMKSDIANNIDKQLFRLLIKAQYALKKEDIDYSLHGCVNPAKRKAMAVKNEKRFLKQKRNALKNPGYSHHPVKTQASFKRLLKAV